ncbi:UMP-CMP kinase 2, mitochondrial [Chanos chanos]|uniref:UMP-CMP kinase 2, mitochondrial n=1 Tax=Chanos chanos TaxID=29144 RepID=A0A6J2WAQ8_CHACN|nr:UMP-CMP kinase 2, mitochondrial [Chanos chanos]
MAKRALLRPAQLCSRIFAVELDVRADPFYFALSSVHKTVDDHSPVRSIFRDGNLYSLHVYCNNRIQRVKFYGELKSKLTKELPTNCDCFELSSFLPNEEQSVIKGFFIRDKSTSSVTEQVLNELQQTDGVCVFSYVRGEDDQLWQELWSTSKRNWMEPDKYRVVPASAPEVHPSVLNIRNSDVFYSLEDAYKVLQECGDIIPESKAVLELVDQRPQRGIHGKFPVVIIEGLDATGKTTLTESLRGSLGAILLKSPPQCLAPFRDRFDSEPPLIRRAFYALGNYITACQISTAAAQAPVIVDRYWHSTAAYAIATAVSGKLENLPGPSSEVYHWPEDLLQPSLVLLLTVNPEERLRRLKGRGLEKTVEEAELEVNHLFRQKVEEAYKRIKNPACIVVDASPSPDKVLQQVLLLISDKCHL